MNTTSAHLDPKEIYQKSVRLLSDTQGKLNTAKNSLKKAVDSLILVSQRGDDKVSNAITKMKVSANNIDVELLDMQLDNLLVLINQSSSQLNNINAEKFIPESSNDASNEEKDAAIEKNIAPVLVDIIHGLSLKDGDAIKQKAGLLETLKNPESTEVYWGTVISKMTLLVNQSIESLQQKNSDLQGFIVKINKQLVDVKSFVKSTQDSREESVNRSSELKESVDTSVCQIQDKVTSANDIDDLKTDISVYLEKISEQVEENDAVEKEKEKLSVENHAQITNELNSAQEELARLKTELQETKTQLLHDTLTGMYNRLAYEDRVDIEHSRSMRTKSPLTLAMWDIDYFKNVNDTYGHDVGDRVLKAFSDVIYKRVRKTDMFARIGGEEFVLLMPDTTAELALTLNNELRETFLKCKFNINGTEFSVSSSVGIAEFLEGDTPESVLKKADKALYESKDTGRNRCTIFKVNAE